MAIDWTQSMGQTFEFYSVDPGTWRNKEKLTTITSCSISRDAGADTLGSASFELTGDISEMYIRIYLIATQNGETERVILGTYLVQSPTKSFDGTVTTISADGYTPLIELSEKVTDLGYYLPKNANIMKCAYDATIDHLRAPVTYTELDDQLDNTFVSSTDETWLSFISSLLEKVKYHLDLEPDGRVIFSKSLAEYELQPVWEFTDDNSSILTPDISMSSDIYGIPNVVEVLYSSGDGGYVHSIVKNEDPDSLTSIPNRGREIIHRVTDPSVSGEMNQSSLDIYAKYLLESMSKIECSVSYTHGYCPVRVGDCILLNYKRAGLTNIKAKVTSQSIDCSTGCLVSETAIFTKKLWEV